MGKSKHNVTKRGTQKQRVKTHDAMLVERYPKVFGYQAEEVPAVEEKAVSTEEI